MQRRWDLTDLQGSHHVNAFFVSLLWSWLAPLRDPQPQQLPPPSDVLPELCLLQEALSRVLHSRCHPVLPQRQADLSMWTQHCNIKSNIIHCAVKCISIMFTYMERLWLYYNIKTDSHFIFYLKMLQILWNWKFLSLVFIYSILNHILAHRQYIIKMIYRHIMLLKAFIESTLTYLFDLKMM